MWDGLGFALQNPVVYLYILAFFVMCLHNLRVCVRVNGHNIIIMQFLLNFTALLCHHKTHVFFKYVYNCIRHTI